MVGDFIFVATIFLLGAAAGYLLRQLYPRPKPVPLTVASSIPIAPQNVVARLLGFKPDPVAPPQPPITETIPRTRGPWRRQRQALQAQFNTKQKERDALTRPLFSKEKSNVS